MSGIAPWAVRLITLVVAVVAAVPLLFWFALADLGCALADSTDPSGFCHWSAAAQWGVSVGPLAVLVAGGVWSLVRARLTPVLLAAPLTWVVSLVAFSLA